MSTSKETIMLSYNTVLSSFGPDFFISWFTGIVFQIQGQGD